MEHIICIAGPTASGKTRLAVELAKILGGEVLSCDSMQIYKGMDIGTAKPTAGEMQGVRHHMLDVIAPQEPFSVGQYVAMADPILRDILARGKPCILAGGTGLYMDSLISGRTFAPLPATGQRERLQAQLEQEGSQVLLQRLWQVDPDSARRLHPSDHKRIIRALEVYLETGETITQHNLQTQQLAPKYRPVWIGLDFFNRQDLYDRIDRRVDAMLQAGLLEEVRSLLEAGIDPRATSMQAIGYREALLALQGQMPLELAVEQMKRNSRRYAKRQLTWFRRNSAINWIMQNAQPDFSTVFSTALSYLPFFDTPTW